MMQNVGTTQTRMFEGYPDLLTPAHIAEITGMSVQYARTMCRTGMLPAVQVGKSRWYVPKQRFVAFLNGEADR